MNSLELLEDRLSLLGHKAGPILFQLPPNFEADADRLAAFCKLLGSKRRYSFEFRHPSWYAPSIFRLLSQHNISLCISGHHDAPAPWRRTAEFVYVRGHGPQGRYEGHYRQEALSHWAERISAWKRRGYDVFVYFDNDQKSAAPADALWAERARDGRRSPWQTIQWVFVSLHFSMSSSVVPLCCSLSTGLFQGLLVCLSDFQSVCWRGSSFGFSLLMGHLVRKIPSIADRSLPRKSKSVNGTHVRTGRFACWFIQRGVLR